MKYFITLILLTTTLTYGQVMETEFPLWLNILLVILILLIPVLWEYSIIDTNYESDFKLRSQRITIGTFEIIYAIAWTLLLWIRNDTYKDIIFLIFIFWTFPIAELVISFVYNKKKPVTLFIKDNELILNRRWPKKRNLTELSQIQFDRVGKKLKLDFMSESEVSIKTTEYNTDEVQKLLEILVEKSENKVIIPPNYQFEMKNTLVG
jgi:hypothetical protein